MTIFVIQARNNKSQNRQSGSDVFDITISLPKIEEVVIPKKKVESNAAEDEPEVEVVVEEKKYTIDY